MFEEKLKCYGSPMEPGDHPELDETDLLYGAEITRYQMLIGCAQWAVIPLDVLTSNMPPTP